ncbi:MAG: hypothetical protein KGI49_03745 [Patescibacteria group bacterium]|nr:hypothetical protein [Patescibacteria group bacterium]
MMLIQSWGDVFTQSLQSVWYGVAAIVPGLVVAIIIFAIGWVLAVLVEKLVESIFKALKIDAALKSAGLEDVVKRAGYNLNSGIFVGALCKWFVIVVFLMASFDILGLNQVNVFLQQVVDYIPQVIIAALIVLIAAVVANTMQKVVVASAKAGHLHVAELAGRVTKWAIWIFAILTALYSLGVAPGIIQTVLTAIFAGGALAFGLAFGLGGKEEASKVIAEVSRAVMRKD